MVDNATAWEFHNGDIAYIERMRPLQGVLKKMHCHEYIAKYVQRNFINCGKSTYMLTIILHDNDELFRIFCIMYYSVGYRYT